MRKVILIAALIASTAVAANATTWVATCNDGKNVQYVQTVNGSGFLYLKTNKDFYQTARLSQISAGDEVVCGAVQSNAPANAEPITQVCINKSKQAIYLKYRSPAASGMAVQDAGVFCAATVTLRATNLKEH
jgi:hypothetical protein